MTPAIDSKAVSKAIRTTVWLKLKTVGFTKFTTRTAWRFGSALHVVNFQSFNSYNAKILGCTTMSFAVNLGLHFDFKPKGGGTEYFAPDNPPNEAQCLFRKPLGAPSATKQGRSSHLVNRFRWFECRSLRRGRTADNRTGQLPPGFTDFSDPIRALRFVETEDENFDRFGPSGTWRFGRPSPSEARQ